MPSKTTHKKDLSSWKPRKLASMFTVRRGGSPRPIEAYITEREDGLNWLKIGDIDVGAKYITKTSSKILKEGLSRTTLVKKGDFILSNSMSFGRPYIMDIDSCIHDGWLTFQDIKIDILDRDFLYYLLSQSKTQAIFTSISAGSGVQNLKKETVSEVILPIPGVSEQNRIVAVLETWDRAIETLTKKIEVKKQVKKGLMQELLTGKTRLKGFSGKWEKMKIKNIGEVVTGNTPPKKNPDYYGDKYLWATAFDFNGVYIEDTKVKLSESGAQVARIVRKGSVLVTCIASIGKNAIAKKEMGFNQQINAIIPHKNFSSEFIYYLIEGSFHKLKEVAGGGALAMISKGVFETITLDFPKIDEQTAVADILTTADNEITTLETKLTLLKDQKKYLLNNLITGEIRTPENLTLYS